MADESPEKRADVLGRISPLLGTQSAQRAVDGLAQKVNKLSDSLDKATEFLNRLSQKSTGGLGNTGTQSGGKPNGGGSTPTPPQRPYDRYVLGGGGGPGDNGGGPGTPGTQSGGKENGGGSTWGGRIGTVTSASLAGLTAAGRMNMTTMVSTNTTAQLMARQSGASWQQIRTGFARDNLTAVNSVDAAQGAANLQRLGYVPNGGAWNQAQRYVSNVALVDPTATASGTANAMADLGTGRTWNFFMSRGINTGTAMGGARNPAAVASQLLSHWGVGAGQHVTRADIAQTMSQNSQFSIGMAQQVAAGNVSQDAADAVRTMLQAELTAQQHGVNRSQFQRALRTNDTKTLSRAGFDDNALLRVKKAEAKARNVEDDTASGFDSGLKAATASLGKFNDMLDGILKMHGGLLGSGVGMGEGFLGTFASGAGLGVGGGLLLKGARKWLGKGGGRKILGKVGSGGEAAGEAGGLLGEAGGWLSKGGKWAGRLLGDVGGPMVGVGATPDTLPAPKILDKNTGKLVDNPAYKKWEKSTTLHPPSGLVNWVENALGDGGRSNPNDGHGGGATIAAGSSAAPSGAHKDNGSKPKGKGSSSDGVATAADAISIAKRYLGTPYNWGHSDPKSGFDCSGLMVYVFKQLGINLPRTAAEQAKVGTPISLRDVRAGDLLFINQGGRVVHVAMSVGGGKIIESPQPGGHVRIVNQYPALNLARRVLGKVGNVGGLGGPAASVSGNQQTLGSMPALGGDLGNLSGITSEAELLASASSAMLGGSFGSDSGSSTGASGKGGNTSGPSGPMPKGSVSAWIRKATSILGVDYKHWAPGLALIAKKESSDNPRAVNNWDSNAAAGHPSKGLMQMIDSTFDAYKVQGHGDIWNPVDNILADIRYIKARYKDIDNVPGVASVRNGGAYKGYAVGSTNIDVDQIAKVHKGEMVIPAAQAEAIRQQLASNTPLAGGGSKGNGVVLQFAKDSIVLHASGPMNDSQATDFAKKIVRMIANNNELKKIAEGVG